MPYGFHNSLRVLNSVSPLTSQPVNPSSLPSMHSHTLPAPSSKNTQFFFLYVPPPLHPPPSSFSLQKANFAESRKPRQDQIQESFSVTEIHQIHYGLYLTLLDTAEGKIAWFNKFELWTLPMSLLHWNLFWIAWAQLDFFSGDSTFQHLTLIVLYSCWWNLLHFGSSTDSLLMNGVWLILHCIGLFD